jgi:hypothetical protein
LLIDGALTPALRLETLAGWKAIRVSTTHLETHRKPPPTSEQGRIGVEALSRTYGLRFVTITRLVEMGALPSAASRKVDGRRSNGFSVKAIELFFAEHRTLSDLAREHECSFQLMVPLLNRLAVPPLIPGMGHTKIYALADLPDRSRIATEVRLAKERNARFKTTKASIGG